jgi:hypothetical protein
MPCGHTVLCHNSAAAALQACRGKRVMCSLVLIREI